MPYPFKLVTAGEKDAGRIAGHAGAHAQLITDELTARWQHKLPKGQKTPTVLQMQTFLREELLDLRLQIRAIEKEHMEELEADIASRLARDENRPVVRERLIQIRGLIESTYGGGSSSKVFGPGVTVIPIDVVALVRVGLVALERLMSPKLNLGKPRFGGVDVDPIALARGFDAPLLRLDKVLQHLEDTLPRTNQSLERKTRILVDLRRRVQVSARLLEAVYVFAGHEDLAERVRVSSHPSRRDGSAAGDTAGDEEPADDAADFPFARLAGAPGGSPPGSPAPGSPAPASPAVAATTEGRPAPAAG